MKIKSRYARKWYNEMVEKYNVVDEKEIEFLTKLAKELDSIPKAETITLYVLLFVGLLMMPVLIGIPVVLYAIFKMVRIDKERKEKAENKFLMWRMSNKNG